MLARLLRRNYNLFVRGRVTDEAFQDKGVRRELVSGDKPPSAFTKVRKYPQSYIPYNMSSGDMMILMALAGFVVIDVLMDRELKAVTHRDDLSHRKFYSP